MPKRKSSYSGPAAKRSRTTVTKSVMRARKRRGPKRYALRVARRAMLSMTETKYTSFGVENYNIYHNGGVGPTYSYAIINNLCSVSVGTAQNTRVGDEIYPVGINMKFWLSNKDNRPNVSWRIMIIACPPDQVTAANPGGLFKGTSGNKILDYVDTDKYNIVYQKLLQPQAGDYSLESSATNKEHSRLHSLWIPIRGRLSYQSDGGTTPKYQRHCLSLVVIGYDAYGTLLTDNIASFTCVGRFYFKDP